MYKPFALLILASGIAAIPLDAKPAGTTPPTRLPSLEATVPNPSKNFAGIADSIVSSLKRQESNPPPEPASPLSGLPLGDVLGVAEGILGGALKKRDLADLTDGIPDFSVSGGPLPASVDKRQLGGVLGGGLLGGLPAAVDKRQLGGVGGLLGGLPASADKRQLGGVGGGLLGGLPASADKRQLGGASGLVGALPISDVVQTAGALGPLGTVKGLVGDVGTVESLAGAVKRTSLEAGADLPTLPLPVPAGEPLHSRLDEQPSNITNPGPMNTTETTNPAQNAGMPPPPPVMNPSNEGQNQTFPGPQNVTQTAPVNGSYPVPSNATEPMPLDGSVPQNATSPVDASAPQNGTTPADGSGPSPVDGPAPLNTTSPVDGSEPSSQNGTEHAPLNPAVDAAQDGTQQGNPLGSFGDITVAQIIQGIQEGIQAIQALKGASGSL
ncbi:hypothetical protein CONPUDRAFT_77060 [Coniophora puteana RWD-64-598 SS2]|uniref:Uncharacterized protein n=1 Tax=Coniophora puteana (strain RWD-64-598) TaxID=741705 RepID=A0A5M3MAB6_CONPW|nr:uncharacterized protein CONPUDRAFT_77060 [Coniophora puteana RWD-64-598 SS2]EIW76047.1 hypothetical protein CONPUDRAFT_77060 [Coniophora puteana RWD-64-598 SS2]